MRNIAFPEFVARPTVSASASEQREKIPESTLGGRSLRLSLLSRNSRATSRMYRPLNPDIARFSIMKELLEKEEEKEC